ncbi:MAG: hypothetical protein K0Q66_236, partial [Chitinophagaceae bacterium]|nr:hypothetical protein [Chitinophagaceae bacterium]
MHLGLLKNCLYALILINISTSLFGQSRHDSTLTRYNTHHPQEKVFVQTDKSYYLPGETIWMKAWCTVEGIPSYLSRILYVDLVNNRGEVVQKKMYRLDSLGSTPADLELPANVTSGTYALNAYTLWMLNFPEFIFHKELFIFGNNYNTGAAPAANEPLIKLQFFPEGGDMVTGLKSRVAFKATTGKSLPAQVKGYVTDNAGNKVTEFVAEHNGMGSFELEPEEGKTYTAAVPGANGAVLTFKLPSAKKDGVTLKTENNNPHKLFVVVDRSLAQKEKYNVVKVVAQVNHQLVYEAHLNLDQDQNAVAINKKGIPPGIMQVTAFDISNNPLAERLAFIENYEIASPTLQADTLNLK